MYCIMAMMYADVLNAGVMTSEPLILLEKVLDLELVVERLVVERLDCS